MSSGPLLLALADDALDGLPDFIEHGHALAVGKVRQVRPAPVVVLERRLAQPLSASLFRVARLAILSPNLAKLAKSGPSSAKFIFDS